MKENCSDEYLIEFEFSKKFKHVPVKDNSNNNFSKRNTKELQRAFLSFGGKCIVGDNKKLQCFVDKYSFLYKKRSEKINLADRFEKISEKLFKPDDRYEHFQQTVQPKNFPNKISLSIACQPIEMEEITPSHYLNEGKRKFAYHYPDCLVKDAEIIGDGGNDLESNWQYNYWDLYSY